MCVSVSVAFRFTCPATGIPVDGAYDESTGRLDLQPDPPVDTDTRLRADCFMWCIRSEATSFLSWADARARLVERGVNPGEL